MELKGLEVCAVSGVPLRYPTVLFMTGAKPRTVMVTVAVLLLLVPSLALNVNESGPT